MGNHISVVEMKSTESSAEIELVLMIGDTPKSFRVYIIDNGGILGVCTGDEIESLIAKDPRKSKLFINSVLSFYKGNSVGLPIEIGNF
jgi:hypothetical protein